MVKLFLRNGGLAPIGTDNDKFIIITDEEYIKIQRGLLILKDGKLVDNQQNIKNQKRIIEIQTRLNKLSQDFVQASLGAEFTDIEERKAEFRELHNELRGLEGKPAREYKTNII